MKRCFTTLTALACLFMSVPPGSALHNSGHLPTTTLGPLTVDVAERVSTGVFGGIGFERIYGTVSGVVTAADGVVGFENLPLNPDGEWEFSSEFELITPACPFGCAQTVFVEAENRGNPELFTWIQGMSASGPPSTVQYPPGFGNGFLFNNGFSYARVQWQTGISAGVPAEAQGVGLVIQQKFGQWLAQQRGFSTMVLMGDSQSGWEVTTFLGEGYNSHPETGGAIFDGIISVNGHGNWLAINQLGDDGQPQDAYVRPNGVPLTPEELLSRPQSDPILVNVGAFTDYYRVRASLFHEQLPHPGVHHYDWPYPHASLFMVSGNDFPFVEKGCNSGVIKQLNPVDMRPYLRKIVSGLAWELNSSDVDDDSDSDSDSDSDGDNGLPQQRFFKLGPAPPHPPASCAESTASDPECTFNPLPGAILATPVVDEDRQPLGGVRFPDVELPLGRPDATPLSHTGTLNSGDLCGNFWAWEPFGRKELRKRYGSVDDYEDAYEEVIEDLVDGGYILEDEADAMIERAVANYASLVRRKHKD